MNTTKRAWYLLGLVAATMACCCHRQPSPRATSDESENVELTDQGESGQARAASDGDDSSSSAGEQMNPPGLDAGFTKFWPSKDTIIFYVSEEGNDSQSGTNVGSPLLTAAEALARVRDGHPDWILFKRGDQFDGLGQLMKSGRSMKEPLLVGSYGESHVRPRFLKGFGTKGSKGAPPSTDFVTIVGLEFYNYQADPKSEHFVPASSGNAVSWLRGTQGLWIEDCVFRFGQVNFQDFEGIGIRNITLFRTQILDSYNTKGHGQGIYAAGTVGLVMDESLIDHNGWVEGVPGGEATIFNHNIYIQNRTLDTVIRDSIVMRASSHGLQFRGGGTVEGNFFFQNPINVLIGGGTTPEPEGVTGVVKGNVILEGVNMPSGQPRGWGIELENIRGAVVEGNIVATCLGKMCRGITAGVAKVSYGDNQVEDWGKDSGPGPARATMKDYVESIGLESLDAFYAALRQQSRFGWNDHLTARSINAYFHKKLSTSQTQKPN